MIRVSGRTRAPGKPPALLPILLLLCLLPGMGPAAAEESHREGHTAGPHSGLRLPRDLAETLRQEMREIEAGMSKMIPALSSGDWEGLAAIAGKVRDSFILKRKLTPRQLRTLHEALPPDFIRRDHRFHETAGKLARAAGRHDAELASFYLYRLHDQCVSCHAGYASERFPGLASPPPGAEHR